MAAFGNLVRMQAQRFLRCLHLSRFVQAKNTEAQSLLPVIGGR